MKPNHQLSIQIQDLPIQQSKIIGQFENHQKSKRVSEIHLVLENNFSKSSLFLRSPCKNTPK
jgi:hypothetical protein